MFLHKILQKDPTHITHHLLLILDKKATGWEKQIRETLVEFGLPDDWEKITQKISGKWKREVFEAGERRNYILLKEDCIKSENGKRVEKTKTKTIVEMLEKPEYDRKEKNEI